MKLLHVDSSILGQGSVSRDLSAQVVATFCGRHPGLAVTRLDLAATPIGHLTAAHLAAAQGAPAAQGHLACVSPCGPRAAGAPAVAGNLGRTVVLSRGSGRRRAAARRKKACPDRSRLHAFPAEDPAAALRSEIAGTSRPALARSRGRTGGSPAGAGQESLTGFAEKHDTRHPRPAIAAPCARCEHDHLKNEGRGR